MRQLSKRKWVWDSQTCVHEIAKKSKTEQSIGRDFVGI